MGSGRWTARSLAEKYLERIGAVDRDGPKVNSVLETNPEALATADGLDQERRAGKVRGPLHGIPILLKDNIDTGDKMQTTAGSLALAGSSAPRDAFIVERLRAAGAVILGKTNLSEWANFRSTNSTSGWSGRGGQTKNPYALNRNPCGSSSGSGAACSANLTALAIGTETNGSIVCPSSANGLVGIKPTVGLWSRSGIIPISVTQDTAGPMCRTVADAALLLGAAIGVDPRDAATARSAGKGRSDYHQSLDPNALKGARLGVTRAGMGLTPKVEAFYNETLQALKSAGAVLVDPADLPDLEKSAGPLELEVMLYEFKDGVEAYLASRGSTVQVRTLKDLIAFNEREKERELPYFGQETFIAAAEKGPLTDLKYRRALRQLIPLARSAIDQLLIKHRLDALVGITGGPAWTTDLVNGDKFSGGSGSASAVAGYPHVTVPAGYIQGLPVGLSFMGGAWTEMRLIQLAYGFEQATKARRAPAFQPVV
jgi:amidase